MFAEPTNRPLHEAETFVEVAQAAVARAVAELDAVAGALDIETVDGQPRVTVASTYFDAAALRRYMTHGFRDDRVRERAKQTLAPAHAAELLDRRQARLLAAALGCLDGACRFILVGPLTGIGPSLGTLRVAGQRELPRAAVDSLNAICAQASVRLAHLGFTTDDAGRGLGGLTPRQRDVARLVARGYTNAEIAQALRVTENAVKKHLKLILATLDLCNRAELAAVTSRALATLDHLDATRLAPGFQLIELPPLSGTSPRRREGRP